MKPIYSAIPAFLANFAENQVTKQVLPFWQQTAFRENGSLFGSVSKAGVPDADAAQGCIVTARALWSFAKAFEQTANARYLETATQLYQSFVATFFDHEQGGVYWSVSPDGNVLEGRKHVVAQAYAIFSVSLYYQVSKDTEAMALAQSLISSTQKHFLRANGTYLSELTRRFEVIESDENNRIETCNQLHILEALTQYFVSTGDRSVIAHVQQLIDLFLVRVFPAQDHFALRFTTDWAITGEEVSYGHNFESGFLVVMACESIEDSVRLEQAQQQLVRLVDYSIAHCKHPSGSYLFGLDKSGTDAKTMYWWTQTEASNALVAAAKITHDYRYYDELISLWESIQAHWIDHKQGEWFSELNTNLKPAGCTNKVDFWRCNYHTTRACFYVARANYYKKYITQPTHNPAPLIA